MKRSFSFFNTVFLILGAVVGAGFISGKEPISYFGTQSPIIVAVICGLLFFGVLFLCFFLNYNEPPLAVPVILAELTVCSAILAGLDATIPLWGINTKFPLFSVLTLLISPTVCKGGIKRLERVNAVMTPLLVLFVVVIFFATPTKTFNNAPSISLFNSLPFVLANSYLALPVVIDSVKGKSKTYKMLTAIIVSGVLGFILFVVLKICGREGANAFDLPIMHFLNGRFYYLTLASLSVATLTSAFTLYYPLYQYFTSAFEKSGTLILGTGLFLFSRLGITNIIEWFYPVIAVFGGVYIIKLIYRGVRYKKREKENNITTLKNLIKE